jgi:hypothetical protein
MWRARLNDKRDLMSLIEICWVASHACMFCFGCVALTATGICDFTPFIQKYGNVAFRIYWAFANGPLAIALLMLNNAMIFHDIPNLASCFIHLTPSSVTWAMRWYKKDLDRAYPGLFVTLPDPENI